MEKTYKTHFSLKPQKGVEIYKKGKKKKTASQL